MMQERDIIRRYVWPELSTYFAPKGYDIQFIDLRWGVVSSPDNGESVEKQILKCCFETIDLCKPFFVGIIGHRYGWIPESELAQIDENPLSVTHLEIEHGVIQPKNYTRTLLLRRDLKSYSKVSSEELNTYIDSDERLKAYAHSQMSVLQKGYEEADALNNIIDYSLDVIAPGEQEVFQFAQLLVSNLKRVIEDELSSDAEYSISHLYMQLLKNYIVPKDICEVILKNTSSSNHSLLYGNRGVGKTSLALYLYCLFNYSSSLNCFFYSTDVSLGDSISFQEAVLSWSRTLSKTNLQELETVNDEWSRFKQLHYQQNKWTIIIIDGYENIREIRESNLLFIPIKAIVFIVFSDKRLVKWEKRFDIQSYEVSGLTLEDAREFIIQTITKSNKKNLPPHLLSCIVESRRVSDKYNPLDLSTLMSYVLSLDKDDYDRINLIKDVPKEQALYDYISSIASEIPLNCKERSAFVMRKVVSIYGKSKITPLIYIAYSLYGLSEFQLQALIPDFEKVSFYLIRNYLKPYMPSAFFNGKWRLFDTDLLTVIKDINHENDSVIFNRLSTLTSISNKEKFYYSLWGYNAQTVYELYSSGIEMNNQDSTWYNNCLQVFFESKHNIRWFLSIFDSSDEDKNEGLLSNLIFTFYNYYARLNPKIDTVGFLEEVLFVIDNRSARLSDNYRYYYMGVVSECLGMELTNRHIDPHRVLNGIVCLENASKFYELSHLADYSKNKVEAYLKLLKDRSNNE